MPVPVCTAAILRVVIYQPNQKSSFCVAYCRDDGQVKAGWAVTKGRRFYNEDQIYLEFHPMPDGRQEGSTRQVACMAVFDGHGGAAASEYVRDHLFNNLLGHGTFHSNLFKAVGTSIVPTPIPGFCLAIFYHSLWSSYLTLLHAEEAYVETDTAYITQDEVERNNDGCTATTAVIVGQTLVVAHVGDSRAVLGENGRGIPLTEDHKPNRPDERQRIENVGGTVVHAGTWRVGGVLAVSRSFGNRQLKQYIVPFPEIREDILHPGTNCLILATDGVWDVVTNDEAVSLVSGYQDAEAAARALATLAYDRESYDNISCVVCLFKFSGDSLGNSAGPRKAHMTADTALPAIQEAT